MQKVIGVRFKKAGKIHYFNPGQVEIERGDSVIVETPRGLECGLVVISPREIANEKLKVDFIHRKAGPNDLAKLAENREKEKEAFIICQNKIAEHDLPMNLISVEYTFDINKIIFSFTADGRVDFRELVKDLAYVFRTRIELRQVGVRDEAKLIGGVGCCGRPLCCASFLGDFVPVSIRMAKEQNLSLNPAKISGICGRLMCCLKYENDYYCEHCPRETVPIKEPKLGARVVIDEGEGKIISINRQRRTATIILDNSNTAVEPWDNIFEAERDDEDIKTIVATVSEEVKIENPEEEVNTIISEDKTDGFNRRPRRSQSLNWPNRDKDNSRSSFQARQNFKGRDNRDSRDNREMRESRNNRDNFEGREFRNNRDFRDNRDNRDRGNRKFQNYQRNKRPPRQ